MRALLVSAPEQLREGLRRQSTPNLLRACARLRALPRQSLEHRATAVALRSAARRALALEAEAAELAELIEALVRQAAPGLLEEPGVGPVSGAQILVSWSHPGRVRSESAFAHMAGVCPVEASSGAVVRPADGKSPREIRRCLKRFVARRIYRLLEAGPRAVGDTLAAVSGDGGAGAPATGAPAPWKP